MKELDTLLVNLLPKKYTDLKPENEMDEMYEALCVVCEDDTASEENIEKMRTFKLMSVWRFTPGVTRMKYVDRLDEKLRNCGDPLSSDVLAHLQDPEYPFVIAYSLVTWKQMCIDGL